MISQSYLKSPINLVVISGRFGYHLLDKTKLNWGVKGVGFKVINLKASKKSLSLLHESSPRQDTLSVVSLAPF